MMDPNTLRTLIQTTLNPLELWSPGAEELLMATCAQESLLGTYRRQAGGPALGIFQMEPEDHDDIWKNFLAYKSTLTLEGKSLLGGLIGGIPAAALLENNDAYAIFMCRVHYLRCPKAVPLETDLNGLWLYYKVNYNSVHGAATQAEFNRHYQALVKGPAT
jgi:hypothetical protein